VYAEKAEGGDGLMGLPSMLSLLLLAGAPSISTAFTCFGGYRLTVQQPRLEMGLRTLVKSKASSVKRRVKSVFKWGQVTERTDAQLKNGIAGFYDESSPIWLDVWGEHMHHGYYPYPGYDDKKAQVAMIDRSVAWAYGKDFFDAAPNSMVDVGCGVGGSSRHLSRKFGCSATGISLSPLQVFTSPTYLSYCPTAVTSIPTLWFSSG
jgi:tocopherol O-methyltransferase